MSHGRELGIVENHQKLLMTVLMYGQPTPHKEKLEAGILPTALTDHLAPFAKQNANRNFI